tara:strand:- start:134 stop:430 length:297 start_codon:yes stop_codon:yes gene_type:complete
MLKCRKFILCLLITVIEKKPQQRADMITVEAPESSNRPGARKLSTADPLFADKKLKSNKPWIPITTMLTARPIPSAKRIKFWLLFLLRAVMNVVPIAQ